MESHLLSMDRDNDDAALERDKGHEHGSHPPTSDS
jgi:hypothetical protein